VSDYVEKGRTALQLRSVEDVVEHFQIDLDKFKIDRVRVGTWESPIKLGDDLVTHTSHQVRVDVKPRPQPFDYGVAFDEIENYVRDRRRSIRRNRKERPDGGAGVVVFSDIHVGAKATTEKGIVATREFCLDTLIYYMEEMVRWVNACELSSVHVFGLGDFVESITGLNHLNSWQGMEEGAHGAGAIKLASELLRDMLSRIVNLDGVYLVSGNHDRLTSDKTLDSSGGAAELVAWYLQACGLPIEYHPLIISKEIDGINYIATHGHHSLIKKRITDLLWKYGKQGVYNVVLSGHLHSRQTKRYFFCDLFDEFLDDAVGHRGVVCPPMFTGNPYSEQLGYTSTAGFLFFESAAGGRNVLQVDVGL